LEVIDTRLIATITTILGTDIISSSRSVINTNFSNLNTELLNHDARHIPGGADALATAIAGASVPGDSAAEGTAASFARSDHRHSLPGFGTPGSSAVGDAPSAGAAATFARSDHQHGRESFGAVSGLANANTNGVATTPARSDHQHKRDVRVAKAGVDVGTRNRLNFIEGSNVTITIVDDSPGDEVDITIAASLPGGAAEPGIIRLIGSANSNTAGYALAPDLKDAYTGQSTAHFRRIHGAGGVGGVLFVGDQVAVTPTNMQSILVIGSKIYYKNASNATTSLYQANRDGTSEVLVTFSGGSPTAGGRMGTDGTFLYWQDGQTSTTIKKYSISGSTLTFVSNITIDFTPTTNDDNRQQSFGVDAAGNMYIVTSKPDGATIQILKKFNSSGVTQATLSIPTDSTRFLLGTIVSDNQTIYLGVAYGTTTDIFYSKIVF